jgi:ADP-ribosylglycohydrolase
MKGSKPLMSEMLDDTRRYLEQAEKTDVSELRVFLMTEPERPMIATGQGGSIPPAEYAALLYSSNCSIGKAMSCYDTHSVSDTAMQNAKLLLVSKSGGNIDVKAFKNRAESINKQHFHMLSTGKLGFKFPDGFISIPNVITNFALLYKAFTGDADIVSKLALSQKPEDNYTYRTVSSPDSKSAPALSGIRHFHVCYGSFGKPVAFNIESDMAEAGLVACMPTDYRNICHGRFLSISNFVKSEEHPQNDVALILLITPREEEICKNLLKYMPPQTPIVVIRTDLTSPLASLDLLYKANRFIADLGEKHLGVNPNDPENYGKIEKEAPINRVEFKEDFEHFAPLCLESDIKSQPVTSERWETTSANQGGVDILVIQFPNTESPFLLAAFDDSREAKKDQETCVESYLGVPDSIKASYINHRYTIGEIRKFDFTKKPAPWVAEWKKWIEAEQARQQGADCSFADISVDLLNDAYINWLGQTLRFNRESDGRISVTAISPSLPKNLTLKGIIGGICGDVLGSKYELEKDKAKVKSVTVKNFKKVLMSMCYSDDTILSMAVAKWLMTSPLHDKETLVDLFKHFATRYKHKTYGRMFREWVISDSREPYGAPTNGCAMRVSPVAWYAQSLEECLALAKTTAEVTHNSEEGIRGAQAIAAAVYLNRTGSSKAKIKSYIEKTFGYDLNRTTDEIRPDYQFETTCDKSVPESIICFLEGTDFMDTVVRAISLGGDTDTMACMAGNIAAATMPVPEDIAKGCYETLPLELREILDEWNNKYHQ